MPTTGLKRSPRPEPATRSAGASASLARQPAAKHKDSFRETVESVVVAFILAFLFRTFEAEAFVIPTGSMAPTLYGRHKELHCAQCGYQYAIGASDEVDKDGIFLPINRIHTAFCPNCRYRMNVKDAPVFKGDRILVNKFPYEFGEPDRWDVVVFKYPEEPQTNYIKRLVGLPGETLRLQQGDVYVRKEDGWEILRKEDPGKQRRLQMLVYDNDYPETALHRQGWPERWAAVKRAEGHAGIAGWVEDSQGFTAEPQERAFRLARDRTDDGQYRWIRYRHIVPAAADWEAVTASPPAPPRPDPKPELIADFCGYNAYTGGNHTDPGYFWVGDLTLNCRVEVLETTKGGSVLLELNEGARRYRCRFDLVTGEATISHTVGLDREADEEHVLATAPSRLSGPGRYRLTFANVDDRLCVWVDDRLVDFGAGSRYQPYGGVRLQAPREADLIPAGIAARHASVRVSHLRLERDVYYRNEFIHPRDEHRDGAFSETVSEFDGSPERLTALLSDPQAWFEEYERGLSQNVDRHDDLAFHFELGPDEFFMLGDNSPRSRDSRLWTNLRQAAHRHAVPRSLLVGKAFYIYWPHGVPFLNDGKGYPLTYHYERDFAGGEGVFLKRSDYPSMRIPFRPYIERMRRIR